MSLLDIIPFIRFQYSMGKDIIDYCETEKDLEININGTLNFSYHSDTLCPKMLSMGKDLILTRYCETEKDLEININGTLNFSCNHSDILYSKSNQRFGLSKRTCHFIQKIAKKSPISYHGS